LGFLKFANENSSLSFTTQLADKQPCWITGATIFAPFLLRQIAKDIALTIDYFIENR
jgi:hypothetical protein